MLYIRISALDKVAKTRYQGQGVKDKLPGRVLQEGVKDKGVRDNV